MSIMEILPLYRQPAELSARLLSPCKFVRRAAVPPALTKCKSKPPCHCGIIRRREYSHVSQYAINIIRVKTQKILINMGKKAITRKEKGSILAFTVVILLVALIIALGIAVATIFGMKNAGASGKSTMAFQVADSGVEIFLKRKKAAYEGHGNIKIKDVESPGALECEAGTGYLKGSLENGKKDFFIIMYDGSDNPLDCKINKTDPLDDVFKIKSSGKYSGTVRAVEVRTRDQLLYKLEAWWSFDDPGSGAKAIDLSGNGNEGTISGDVIYDDEGKIGEALTFDGSTNSVDMGNQISLDITGPITLSVWIKPQSLPSGIRQIVNQNSK